jgi:hypothetical protein
MHAHQEKPGNKKPYLKILEDHTFKFEFFLFLQVQEELSFYGYESEAQGPPMLSQSFISH